MLGFHSGCWVVGECPLEVWWGKFDVDGCADLRWRDGCCVEHREMVHGEIVTSWDTSRIFSVVHEHTFLAGCFS
jgi:hypothetical protein